jgi:branched-chain amino acid transport system substrate-binding protein
VAKSLFGILQKNVGDACDSGLQFPIIADGAAKVGLADLRMVVPQRAERIRDVQVAVRLAQGDSISLKTIYGGVEKTSRIPTQLTTS